MYGNIFFLYTSIIVVNVCFLASTQFKSTLITTVDYLDDECLCSLWGFLAFDFYRFCVVIRFFLSQPQRPM